ncbi:MAG: DUF1800 domain-containing protein [Geminicoccaceae bacterium]
MSGRGRLARAGCGFVVLVLALRAGAAAAGEEVIKGPGPAAWQGDLAPISADEWSYDRAAHLLERAGFGGTPEEIAALAAMSPQAAISHLVDYEAIANDHLPPFDPSDIHDPGLVDFPPSRPATTELAKETGEALGVKVKPAGNRPLQPVVNKFFYWLRASMLETRRVAYWWADRMLKTERPLEEKMTLFWHGHFATSEDKVRDFRKMLRQNRTFRRHATGDFRELVVAIAQDPAMLYYLDAGVNVKGAPNENFAREIMELFTMGVGNYGEADIREAARAFTGWNADDLTFVVHAEQHDDGAKTVLGQTGDFDGVEVIDIIMAQPATADFIAGKLFRYLVREDLDRSLQVELGAILRAADYQLKPLLRTMFLSRDFYSRASMGTHIKSPAQLVVSTYKKLGAGAIPGIPDLNEATAAMGQALFWPPTVAGWAQGRSWITPGLLLERGNFALEVLFPDIAFVAHDRHAPDPTILAVHERIRHGHDITSATVPDGMDGGNGGGGGMMAESNMLADRDEDFNTRYGSYRGWQMAIARVKPIPRAAAEIDLAAMVRAEGLTTTAQVVDYFLLRFMSVPIGKVERQMLIDFLDQELGTSDVVRADSYLEDPLRMLVHLIMSQPEYQLG